MVLSSININLQGNSSVFNTSLRTLLIMHGSIKFPQGLSFIPDSNKPESAIFVSSVGSLFSKDLTFRAYSRVPMASNYIQ